MLFISLSDIVNQVRVFKNKWFNRWANRESVSDDILLKAAQEIVEGKTEADLGGSLFKKRLPRTGGGKRGGYRTIVGYKKSNSERIIFLYAFGKNDKKNISAKEEVALSRAAEVFISLTAGQVNKLLTENSIWEVQYHE